ncbi:tail fiber domain-containing protein [Aerosakkonemataceae cyanobacterium BLCC-F50]|uniref:Tail fiber domain-containing protein n=1 Tax=Floridaenema flaviceps BLCC-F50 TaxID=3153642 RepID=A0ABV4XV16_9CYAN
MYFVPPNKPGNNNINASEKKVYSTPLLINYGTIADITSGGGGVVAPDLLGSANGFCDQNLKENFRAVNKHDILKRLLTITIQSWNYKAQNPSIRHIGPMAQDFAAAFEVGEDDKHIHMVDAYGVAILSIQALYEMIREQEREISLLRADINELKQGIIKDKLLTSANVKSCCG